MLGIAQHQLERVLAWRQIDKCLGLTRSEMQMGLVLRDRLFDIERFSHINQHVMMAAVLEIVARMGDSHIPQAKTAPEGTLDGCAVARPDEIENRILWRGLSLRMSGARHRCQRHRQHDDPGFSHHHAPLNVRERERPGIRVSDIEHWCRSKSGLPAVHNVRRFSRIRIE